MTSTEVQDGTVDAASADANASPASSGCQTDRIAPSDLDVAAVIRECTPATHDGDETEFGIDLPVFRIREQDQIAVETEPCPVCGLPWSTPLYALAQSRFRLVRCDDCGLGSLFPKPDAAEIAKFYPPSYYGTAGAKFGTLIEWAVHYAAKRRARWMLQELPRGGRVLDVGCGRGTILKAMASAGYEPHGFEISETAAEGLGSNIAVRYGNQLSDADYPKHHFDLVVIWHVLEHLPDPRGTLREIHRILKPGGRIAVSVPNFASLQANTFGPAWFHLDLPRHLYHFSASALMRLLGDCGFGIEHERHFSLRQNPFGWVQSFFNACAPRRRNALYSVLKRSRGRKAGPWRIVRNLAWTVAAALGMPASFVLSAIAAGMHSGATINLTARARRDPSTLQF